MHRRAIRHRMAWMLGLLGFLRLGAGTVHYELVGESHFLDACPPCGRPDIPLPLRGGFDLEPAGEDPLYTTYSVRSLDFRGTDLSGGELRLTGSGELVIGGEVAVTHRLRLVLTVSMGGTRLVRTFTNDAPGLDWYWPNLATGLTAEETTFTQVLHLRLRAVPAAAVWFLTRGGMTPGGTPPAYGHLDAGDVLSQDGHRVRRLSQLTSRLGIMPGTAPPFIDAIDVLPGGELAFSLREPVFSETLGDLRDGDILSESGRVELRGVDLLQAFRPGKPVDAGLDAFQRLSDGEVLFSTVRPVPLPSGDVLDPGDILSNRGRVVRRFRDLIAPFAPDNPSGLQVDALHVWPSGEVWFSVDAGFRSADGTHHGEGDLLSSHGWVVWRNLDLVAPYQPLEDLADFGLTGIIVVSDLDPPPGPALAYRPARTGDGLTLTWAGPGRVFRVETADRVGENAEWRPAGDIGPDTSWTRTGPAGGDGSWFRIRSW